MKLQQMGLSMFEQTGIIFIIFLMNHIKQKYSISLFAIGFDGNVEVLPHLGHVAGDNTQTSLETNLTLEMLDRSMRFVTLLAILPPYRLALQHARYCVWWYTLFCDDLGAFRSICILFFSRISRSTQIPQQAYMHFFNSAYSIMIDSILIIETGRGFLLRVFPETISRW